MEGTYLLYYTFQSLQNLSDQRIVPLSIEMKGSYLYQLKRKDRTFIKKLIKSQLSFDLIQIYSWKILHIRSFKRHHRKKDKYSQYWTGLDQFAYLQKIWRGKFQSHNIQIIITKRPELNFLHFTNPHGVDLHFVVDPDVRETWHLSTIYQISLKLSTRSPPYYQSPCSCNL